MRIGRSGQASARPRRGTIASAAPANTDRRLILFSLPTLCATVPRRDKIGQAKARMGVRDGQGLEVANADADAIGALDFLRDEWLVFGKRLDRFVAAADKEEKCA